MSDTDVELPTGMCDVDKDDAIRSVSSNNYPLRFSDDSFAIHYTNDIIHLYMNPMFVWRMIFANRFLLDTRKEFNFYKLKMFVIRLDSVVYVTNNHIKYTFEKNSYYKPSKQYFELFYTNFCRLYKLIKKGYDQTKQLDIFFDNYMNLLRYISDS